MTTLRELAFAGTFSESISESAERLAQDRYKAAELLKDHDSNKGSHHETDQG